MLLCSIYTRFDVLEKPVFYPSYSVYPSECVLDFDLESGVYVSDSYLLIDDNIYLESSCDLEILFSAVFGHAPCGDDWLLHLLGLPWRRCFVRYIQ